MFCKLIYFKLATRPYRTVRSGGERLTGSQEVVGSSPIFSTNTTFLGGFFIIFIIHALIMFYTYIIYSINFKKYYVGLSANVNQRLKSHNAGKVKSTKAFTPWVLIHFEKFDSRIEARKREKYLKSAAGRKWRKNNLNVL